MLINQTSDRGTRATFEVHAPSLRYLDMFVRLKCAPMLLMDKLFPNAKEVTESVGAFRGVKEALKAVYGAKGLARLGHEDVVLLDVGCGHQPRTAALIAQLTKWMCYAIDPLVKWDREIQTQRVTRVGQRIEEFRDGFFRAHKLVVVTAVHSHAKLTDTLRTIDAKEILVVSIPCCFDISLPDGEVVHGYRIAKVREYEDHAIWSEKRHVTIYHCKREEEKEEEE